MPLSHGTRLGPHEILAPMDGGGMGEVYRAHDSRLNRDVAIKVSTARFTERFTREARAIAALNHTNICHLSHEKNIVHRDLKPANIAFTASENGAALSRPRTSEQTKHY